VPAVPNTTTTQVDFIFNAFQSQYASGIIQPVLEWNYTTRRKWTGAAWYMSNGQLVRDNTSPVINIAVGDTIGDPWFYNL